MARDYSKKKAVKRKPSATTKAPVKKSSGGLIYATVGLAVGLFIAFLVFLEEQPSKNTKSLAHPSSKQIQNKQTQKKYSSKKKETSKRSSSNSKQKIQKKVVPKKVVPDYEFYTMLPDVEVEVDIPDIALEPNIKPKTKESKATSSKKSSNTKKIAYNKSYSTSKKKQALKKFYQLQVGAFSAKSKADSMKAQLAFMGVQSTVFNGKLNNGKKVYKVKIGPSSDENKLKVIKAKLKRMHINAFLQKL